MIKMNKPLDEMKDEVFAGMGWRELIYGAVFLIVTVAVTALLVAVFHLSPMVSVYAGVVCAAPIMFVGLYTMQGMTLFQYFKKKRWQKKVGTLTYEAQELPEEIFVWSMERK